MSNMNSLLSNIKYFLPGILLFYFNLDVAIWSAASMNTAPIMYGVQLLALLYFFRKQVVQQLNSTLLLLLSAITLLVALVHGFTSPTYVYKIFLYTLIFMIIRSSEFEYLQKSFYKVAFFFAAVSLLFYIACDMFGMHFLLPVGFYGGAGAPYATNFLYTQLEDWSVRNTGIFREPGVYQIYLNIALLFYYNQNRDKIITPTTAVLALAVITTMSSGGIVVALAIIGYQFTQQRKRSFASFLLFAVFAVVLYVLIKASFNQIFYKLMLGTEESGSAFARYYSLIVPMRMWLDYPIFGCGASEFNDLIYFYPTASGERMNPNLVTNCITVNFATSGIIVGLFYLFGTIKGAATLAKNYKIPIIASALMLVMFSCEGIMYSGIFNLILLYGLCVNKKSLI